MGNILKYVVPVFFAVLIGFLVFATLKACQNKSQPSVTSKLDNSGLTDSNDEAEKETADLFAEEKDEPEMLEEDPKENNTDEEEKAAENGDNSDTPTVPRNPGNGSLTDGDFLVLAGTFISQQNAKNEVSRLQNLGYGDAEVVEFDFSEYHTVCVARKATEREANTIKRALVNQHQIEAYVHKKRPRKRKR